MYTVTVRLRLIGGFWCECHSASDSFHLYRSLLTTLKTSRATPLVCGLITQSSNLARATNQIKHLACSKALNLGAFLFCDEVCDVTKIRTFIYDHWARDEYWHPFWHLVRFQRHRTRMQEYLPIEPGRRRFGRETGAETEKPFQQWTTGMALAPVRQQQRALAAIAIRSHEIQARRSDERIRLEGL